VEATEARGQRVAVAGEAVEWKPAAIAAAKGRSVCPTCAARFAMEKGCKNSSPYAHLTSSSVSTPGPSIFVKYLTDAEGLE
jgi:hypothetical protein